MDRVRPLDSDGPLQSVLVSAYALGLNDPPFFDQDFLPTLLGLGGVRHRGFSSPATLERGLGKIYCGLVWDAHALVRGGRPSLHVDVIPVGSQIQHAKVILIHRERMIRLIISSANLTHESFRLNREAAVALEFHERSYMPSGILAEFARNWLERVGTAATADFGAALQQAVAQAAKWDSPRNLPITVKTIWGGGEEPLWKQIVECWPEGEHIKEWHVCSPFWPTVTDGETPFERFQSELNKRAARN
jgi:phosphatidylserine/phosphatidylglycerophosphate/cardiolipin synthase-like enzyme